MANLTKTEQRKKNIELFRIWNERTHIATWIQVNICYLMIEKFQERNPHESMDLKIMTFHVFQNVEQIFLNVGKNLRMDRRSNFQHIKIFIIIFCCLPN